MQGEAVTDEARFWRRRERVRGVAPAARTGVVSLDAVLAASTDPFAGRVAAGNVAAARAAYELMAGVSTDA